MTAVTTAFSGWPPEAVAWFEGLEANNSREWFAGGDRAGFYVDVSADGLVAGGGCHGPTAAQLARQRAAIDQPRSGAVLTRLVGDAEAAGLELFGDTVRTAPRGFAVDHPRIDLLRRKDLVLLRREAPGGVMHAPGARDWITATWQVVRPVLDWLARHVGGG